MDAVRQVGTSGCRTAGALRTWNGRAAPRGTVVINRACAWGSDQEAGEMRTLSEGGMYTFLCFKKPCVFSSRSALLNTSSMSSFLRCSDTQEKFLQLCDIFASNAHNKILNKEPAGFKSPNTCVGSFISRLTFGSIGVLKPRHSSFPCKSSRIYSTTAFASNLSACAVDANESSTYMRARILSKRAKPA